MQARSAVGWRRVLGQLGVAPFRARRLVIRVMAAQVIRAAARPAGQALPPVPAALSPLLTRLKNDIPPTGLAAPVVGGFTLVCGSNCQPTTVPCSSKQYAPSPAPRTCTGQKPRPTRPCPLCPAGQGPATPSSTGGSPPAGMADGFSTLPVVATTKAERGCSLGGRQGASGRATHRLPVRPDRQALRALPGRV